MEISIRDATLMAAGFRAVGEGLDFLGLSSVELAVDRDHQVSAIRPERTAAVCQSRPIATWRNCAGI